jgi:hypothetical protein
MTWAGKNVAWAMNNDKGKKTIRAAYYAAQVFYSFFVMYVYTRFITYFSISGS